MIQLFDFFHRGSQDLHYSLSQAGFTGPTVVINDDGFLPQAITSPYSFFCQMGTGQGKPLYFNQIKVPPFWEITGTNSEGEIWDYNQKKARIFYAEPKHRRLVKNVDWLDRQDKVRFTDHYNQYGWLYARTYFTKEQQATTRTYFNQEGQEVIVENFMTGDLILNWQGKMQFFANRSSFLQYYFQLMGWDCSQLVYNSLSTPFFVSYHLPKAGRDLLFWQEDIGSDLPGNMKVLLGQSHPRTQKIIVQNKEVYHKILGLLPSDQHHKFSYLGYIYPEYRSNQNRLDILIFTNSDQIEQLDYLTTTLPEFRFHIAALTEMSPLLSAFDRKSNVQLYPSVSPKTLDSLFARCDIYLDIHHGAEVMDAVRRAFEQNMLIVAFDRTAHHPALVMKEHILPAERPQEMVAVLKASATRLTDLAQAQRRHTSHETLEAYQACLREEVNADDQTK